MIRKTGKSCKMLGLALGAAALGAPALVTSAQAQPAGASMSMSAPSSPTMVSGKVNNYWTDESGYVTAVDVQTANGPSVVSFGPGMGNRLMQTYPVGSTANLWVQGSTPGGKQRWDMVGMGEKQPSMWSPVAGPSGLDLLNGPGWIENNAETMSVEGSLKKIIADRDGNVVGLVLETDWIGKGATYRDNVGGNKPRETVWTATDGGTPTWTLVRVGPEFRSAPNPGESMRRRTPLMLNDTVTATGYMEAPTYGVVSSYGKRFSATGIAVNSRSVGQVGFGMYRPEEKAILGFDLNIPLVTGGSSKSLPVVPIGYETYSPNMSMGMPMGQGNAMNSK